MCLYVFYHDPMRVLFIKQFHFGITSTILNSSGHLWRSKASPRSLLFKWESQINDYVRFKIKNSNSSEQSDVLPNEPITPETMAGCRRSEFKLSQKNINATLIQIQRSIFRIILFEWRRQRFFFYSIFDRTIKGAPRCQCTAAFRSGLFLINNFCLWFSCGVHALLLFPVLSTLMNEMPVT